MVRVSLFSSAFRCIPVALIGLAFWASSARASNMSPFPNPALFARAAYFLLDVLGDEKDADKAPKLFGLLQIMIDNAQVADNKSKLIHELDFINRAVPKRQWSEVRDGVTLSRLVSNMLPTERLRIGRIWDNEPELIERLVKVALFGELSSAVEIQYRLGDHVFTSVAQAVFGDPEDLGRVVRRNGTPMVEDYVRNHALSLIMTYLLDPRAEKYDPEVRSFVAIKRTLTQAERERGDAVKDPNYLDYSVTFTTRALIVKKSDETIVATRSVTLPARADHAPSVEFTRKFHEMNQQMISMDLPFRANVRNYDPNHWAVWFTVQGLKHLWLLEGAARPTIAMSQGNPWLYHLGNFAEGGIQRARGYQFLFPEASAARKRFHSVLDLARDHIVRRVKDASAGLRGAQPNGGTALASVADQINAKIIDENVQLAKALTNVNPKYKEWLFGKYANQSEPNWLENPVADKEKELVDLTDKIQDLERKLNGALENGDEAAGFRAQLAELIRERALKLPRFNVLAGKAIHAILSAVEAEEYRALRERLGQIHELIGPIEAQIAKLAPELARLKEMANEVILVLNAMRKTFAELCDLPRSREAVEAAIERVRARSEYVRRVWSSPRRAREEYKAAQAALELAEKARIGRKIQVTTEGLRFALGRRLIGRMAAVGKMKIRALNPMRVNTVISAVLIVAHIGQWYLTDKLSVSEAEKLENDKRLAANLITDVIYLIPVWGQVAAGFDFLVFLTIDPALRYFEIENRWFGVHHLVSRFTDWAAAKAKAEYDRKYRFQLVLGELHQDVQLTPLRETKPGEWSEAAFDAFKTRLDGYDATQPGAPEMLKSGLSEYSAAFSLYARKHLYVVYNLAAEAKETLRTAEVGRYERSLFMNWIAYEAAAQQAILKAYLLTRDAAEVSPEAAVQRTAAGNR
jgi:hypothetical protein